MKKIFHGYVLSLLLIFPVELFAGLGMHGSQTINSANVILNEFTTLTANATVGTFTISVGSSSLNANGRFAGNLVAGELIMIIQMQGVNINTANPNAATWGSVTAYNNAGKFEFNEVASVPNATTITFVDPLVNSYTSSGKVQIVRVPRYTSFHVNVGGSVTTPPWNGSTGGIVVIESNGATILQGTIDVTGKGFKGGIVDSTANSNHTIFASTLKGDGAEKGEGVAGNQTTYDLLGGRYGRGAPANGGGGGNSHNAGGGGGANAGNISLWNGKGNPDTITNINWKLAWDLEGGNFHANVSTGGGRGGYTYSMKNKPPLTTGPGHVDWNGDDRSNVGGYGGRPLVNAVNRIYFGGGGGAGDNNNNTGTGGGNGGGIVFLLSGGAVNGNGSISANGADALNSTANDAAGGGGGGGTVVVYTKSAPVNSITINAKGGKGGNQQRIVNSSGEAEGPGGGGGGGMVQVSNAGSITININGGANGTTNSPTMVTFTPNGATMGFSGISTIPSDPYSGDVPLPVSLLSFTGQVKNDQIILKWITSSELNNDFFAIEKSVDGSVYTKLGTVPGAGNSNVELNYEFIDDKPQSGKNYYRLTQTDFDGATKVYTPICIQYNSKTKSFYISSFGPNPVSDFLNIYLETDKNGMMQMRLINSTGITVYSKNITVEKGIFSYEFTEIKDFAPGLYIVQMVFEDKVSEVIRISKK